MAGGKRQTRIRFVNPALHERGRIDSLTREEGG